MPKKSTKPRKRKGIEKSRTRASGSSAAPESPRPKDCPFVSRGGIKLAAALDAFQLTATGLSCADLGCNVGGFTDCLLQRGARRVYAVDTGYGALDFELRKNERVIVMERTNALHVHLPEQVDLVVIDAAWTRQRHIVPAAATLLKTGGRILTLVKPHYEVGPKQLKKGVLSPDQAPEVLEKVLADLTKRGFTTLRWIESPIKGDAGNREFLVLLAQARVHRHPHAATQPEAKH